METNQQTVYIYRLVNPEGWVYYVGQTVNPNKRAKEHGAGKKTGIRFEVIEPVELASAREREAYWIRHYHALGMTLKNDQYIPRPPKLAPPPVDFGRPPLPSDVARRLRAIPSEKRAEASRQNGRRPRRAPAGRPRRDLADLVCPCEGRASHLSTCPRARAAKRRGDTLPAP